MIHICNLDRVENAVALGNSPLWFGEWALPTQFDASEEFVHKWADAQKLAYGKGKGWIVSGTCIRMLNRELISCACVVLELQG